MSAFWLGVFTGLAVWHTINFMLALAMKGKTTEWGYTHIAQYAAYTLITLLGAVLTYTGVIL